MAKIRVLMNGAKGRMGQTVAAAIREEKDLELAAECDLGDDLAAALKKCRASVAVDFTHPDSAVANARAILEAGVRPVIGTTGFSEKDVRELQTLAERKKLGGLIAPNFSIGMLLLNRFAAEAVKHFFHVEIVELHHNRKADAPSGTAEQSASIISKAAGRRLNAAEVRESERVRGVRGGKVGEIPIHSVRLPGLLAHQEILFGGPGQLLTLRHDATGREAYVPGILLAIRKAPSLRALLYGLEKLLFEE